MAYNQKLITDQDFQQAMDREAHIRVFQDDHVVGAGGVIARFTDDTIVIQYSVSDVTYHSRRDCEFFEIRKR
ncbi:hypothetical protein O9H85_07375 [Paenibacillus filicis]|uniref:Uncharacterized protein n=1 Tax=Paenibacillus gyeongsangnamensis TaxID=3388067 RepID=A0ABT4Q5Y6_9BACL|nr:hypothetical protein [Paenibacillus filicis]MCZ8512251.1 hypothetical protein [Paenibacillus filicis]